MSKLFFRSKKSTVTDFESITIEDKYGIRILHKPESPEVDIVFVHGLTGGQTTTWTADGENASWPEKLLAEDIPTARILAFGYDADVVKLLGQASQNSIGQHARNLLGDLADMRFDSNTKELPIIFVAHSLGGLVCMNHQNQILNCTQAIAFLGTPHRGSQLVSWAKLAANLADTAKRANKKILDTLNPNSEVLSILVNDFHPMLRSREMNKVGKVSITCYSEELAVSKWGKSFMVVPEFSATLQQYPQKTIHADHVSMTKFKARDSGYKKVSLELKRWISEMQSPIVSGQSKVSSNVPFARDAKFVGRIDIMKGLEARLSAFTSHQRIALAGLGGMGKSQIAIEFSYRLRIKSPTTWVFWVHASSYTRFEQSYRDIADLLQLPGRDDPKVDILRLVSQWLRDETNGRWLLILDNADDANIFTHTVSQQTQLAAAEISHPSLLTYIPQTSKGSILVTSRNRDAASRLVGGDRNIIAIGPMDQVDAFGLLKAKLSHESSDPDSRKLLEALGQIPLAITQAAAYISRPRMSVTKYLDLFYESENSQSSLLDIDEGDLRRDPQVPNAVITTWQISFNQIRNENPFATDILSLMSVLNRQGILESLLPKDGTRLEFEEALAVLCGFSLIVEELHGNSFEIHRLVQLATRAWLLANGEIAKWNQKALMIVSETFPEGSYENLTVCAPLLSHVEAVLSYNLRDPDDLIKKASILHNLAAYLWYKGDYRLSKLKIDQAIEIGREYLGEEDSKFLSSINLCAVVLSDQGNFQAAEQMYRQILELDEKVRGVEHPETLTIMNNLAMVLGGQGKYEAAEQMHRQQLRLSEKVLGAEHPDRLTSMNNLAFVLRKQGKYEAAEQMHRQGLELCEKVLGAEHPNTLMSMNNLALVLNKQGKYEAAEQMHQQTLKLQKKVLGTEHPGTLMSMYNLAEVFSEQGKYEAAEQMHRQTLKLHEKVLGAEHPETLKSMNSLAAVLSQQHNYETAEQMHQQTLKLQKEVLGAEHPDTLTSMSNLALVLGIQGNYEMSEKMHWQVLKLHEKVLGAEHPETLKNMDNLAVVLSEQEKYEAAEQMQRQTLKLKEKVLGDQHPDTLSGAYNLAYSLHKQKQYDEASMLYERAYLGFQKTLGLDHPTTQICGKNYTFHLEQMK